MIDLRSDTVTKPSENMRRAMFEAEVGDDVFGEDPTVIELEKRTAALLGKEKALYVPSGTMANQIVLAVLTHPGDEVYLEQGSHIFNYESGAAGFISGVQLYPIQGNRGTYNCAQLEESLRPSDDHFPPSRAVVVENTHNRGGGTVWDFDDMKEICEFTRNAGLKMHLDGARLWNASAASGIAEKDWAQYADTVSVCFSKGLGAPVGSAIASSEENIMTAHRMRKRLGGGMRQAGIIAAGALYALENNRERLSEDHHRAKTLAKGLTNILGIAIDPTHVETNILIIELSRPAEEFAIRLKENGILVTMAGRKKIRMVTHLEISDEDIEETIGIIRAI
ncbi:threonine aldolase family protein [Calditrichota bacterium]